jgi:hypothetical protein
MPNETVRILVTAGADKPVNKHKAPTIFAGTVSGATGLGAIAAAVVIGLFPATLSILLPVGLAMFVMSCLFGFKAFKEGEKSKTADSRIAEFNETEKQSEELAKYCKEHAAEIKQKQEQVVAKQADQIREFAPIVRELVKPLASEFAAAFKAQKTPEAGITGAAKDGAAAVA